MYLQYFWKIHAFLLVIVAVEQMYVGFQSAPRYLGNLYCMEPILAIFEILNTMYLILIR